MMPGHLNHQHFLVLLKYLRKSGIGEINSVIFNFQNKNTTLSRSFVDFIFFKFKY